MIHSKLLFALVIVLITLSIFTEVKAQKKDRGLDILRSYLKARDNNPGGFVKIDPNKLEDCPIVFLVWYKKGKQDVSISYMGASTYRVCTARGKKITEDFFPNLKQAENFAKQCGLPDYLTNYIYHGEITHERQHPYAYTNKGGRIIEDTETTRYGYYMTHHDHLGKGGKKLYGTVVCVERLFRGKIWCNILMDDLEKIRQFRDEVVDNALGQ